MAGSWRPDIVFGIDVGQTCTGVAYSYGPDWSEPRNMNKWPGSGGIIQKEEKVATRVAYSKESRQLVKWGFEASFDDPATDVREQFKLTLDSDYEDDRGITCADARRYYLDFLTSLYHEIVNFLVPTIPNWREQKIEYNFSTPTTWKNPAMIASIEDLILQAGFASSKNQRVRMGLTEAEAAAIEASMIRYKPGDVFLICDAGGGTTDVNILRVLTNEPTIKLEPLDHVEGAPVGSTLIDFRMIQHILPRLEMVQSHLEMEPLLVAEDMLENRFQSIKHNFPNPRVNEYLLEIKHLPGSQTFPEAGIFGSRMRISRSTLQEMFDEQVNRVLRLIDFRLSNLRQRYPEVQVSHIILSGGLGSSPYLYQRLEEIYRHRVEAPIHIMRVPDPQLAIIRGLVKERTQQLGNAATSGAEVFSTRRCRNSYGVLVRVRYDQAKHGNQATVIDRFSSERWVNDGIDWFIKRGDPITADKGIARPYMLTVLEKERYLERKVEIVMSDLPPNELPNIATQAGCRGVAIVKYKLTDNDMHLNKAPRWSLTKKAHYKADFKFVVKLGPADLRFQITGKNGTLSSDHDSLVVEFVEQSDGRPTAGRTQQQPPVVERRYSRTGPSTTGASNSVPPASAPSRTRQSNGVLSAPTSNGVSSTSAPLKTQHTDGPPSTTGRSESTARHRRSFFQKRLSRTISSATESSTSIPPNTGQSRTTPEPTRSENREWSTVDGRERLGSGMKLLGFRGPVRIEE